MESVINRANQLLQHGEPEQALLLLNEQGNTTSECEQLKSVCKQTLAEQYLWILNDAAKNNRRDEIKAYVNRYHNLIGHDGRIVRYEAMLTKDSTSSNLKKSTTISLKNDVGELALIPVVMLFLGLLVSAFSGRIYEWEWVLRWNWERPWVLASCVGDIFYLVYLATASFVFAKISNNSNKLYLAWTIISLLIVLSDFISGFNYESFGFLLTLRIFNTIAVVLLVVFLIMEMRKTAVYKVPLIVGTIAESITLINIVLGTHVAYKRHITPYYLYVNLDSLYKAQNITYYTGTILMVATFLLFFLTSKKLKQKKYYGTN